MPKQILNAPNGPQPIGAYSIATEANGFVFMSGQVAIDPATNAPVMGEVAVQARQVMANIEAVLADVGLGIEDVVKTTIFLADIADFPVVNRIYGEYFESGKPARSTVQAGALPGGYQVEIEVIAAR
ncbi:MAG: reactive intermediate/imine deaminase [bacterium]|nr:reactive intermediate/imine deaminase [bacterium]